jgi:hypothetical protein
MEGDGLSTVSSCLSLVHAAASKVHLQEGRSKCGQETVFTATRLQQQLLGPVYHAGKHKQHMQQNNGMRQDSKSTRL